MVFLFFASCLRCDVSAFNPDPVKLNQTHSGGLFF
ncbi:hypothetical protein EL75_2877 [Escherichia coli]|nr:hypothetical protein EL75_2877 [Escherichia coli]KGM78253.1 hypothetical protein EL80_2888 [Escherichia coli]KGM81236.1 hypothetical protein EL79_2949 [Escherichia coli]DAR61398.1 MAG TPA: hypothetical protein [Caudoviricetes sp.]DAU42304.1 MAG TPA: hypothetical protein [Caudoviricetes sp.]